MHIIQIYHWFFVQRKRLMNYWLSLQARGYSADGLTVICLVSTRQVMSKFKPGTIDILVATDVATGD